MVFGFGRRHQDRQDKVDEEVKFWKRELDKCVHEKNWFLSKYAETHRLNRILQANMLLQQQQQQSLQEQINRQQEQQEQQTLGSCVASPRSPPASSTGSVYGSGSLASPGGTRMLEIQLSSCQARLREADLAMVKSEERIAALTQELRGVRAELECVHSTSQAYAAEAEMLRSQLVQARGLGDDTAGQAAWLAQQLHEVQAAAQKLRTDANIKDEMLDLLKQQLSEVELGESRDTVDSDTSSEAATPAPAPAPASIPASARHSINCVPHPMFQMPRQLDPPTDDAAPTDSIVDPIVPATAAACFTPESNPELVLLHSNLTFDSTSQDPLWPPEAQAAGVQPLDGLPGCVSNPREVQGGTSGCPAGRYSGRRGLQATGHSWQQAPALMAGGSSGGDEDGSWSEGPLSADESDGEVLYGEPGEQEYVTDAVHAWPLGSGTSGSGEEEGESGGDQAVGTGSVVVVTAGLPDQRAGDGQPPLLKPLPAAGRQSNGSRTGMLSPFDADPARVVRGGAAAGGTRRGGGGSSGRSSGEEELRESMDEAERFRVSSIIARLSAGARGSEGALLPPLPGAVAAAAPRAKPAVHPVARTGSSGVTHRMPASRPPAASGAAPAPRHSHCD